MRLLVMGRILQSSLIYILAVLAVGLTVAGQVLVKMGMDQVGAFTFSLRMFVQAFTNWRVVLGFVLAFGGSVFWLGVVSRVPFSVAYPLLSMSYIFGLIAAFALFRERISISNIIGTLLICIGIVLAARRS